MQKRLALRRCCAYERAALVWKKWVNSGRLALTGLDQAWPGELIVPVESTHVEISWKAGHFGALNCLMVQTMIETSHFGPKTDQNFIFPVLMQGVAVSWASTLNGASTLALACLLVWSSRSTWLGLSQEGG